MKHVLLGAALLLPVHAWAHDPAKPVTPAGSSSVSGPASATVNNAVRSSVRNAVRNTNNVTVTQSSGADPGGANAGWGGAGGRGGNAPDVVAPSISGGDSCGLAATAGGSGMGGGGILGFMWESHDCDMRQKAALMANMGRPDVAIQLLCEDAYVRDAMAKAGTPCEVDRQRWLAAGWKP